MKKILFKAGELSQLPGVFAPVYHVADSNIFQEPNSLKVLPSIDVRPSKHILIDEFKKNPFVLELSASFTRMQDKIENIDFSKFEETEDLLNFNLEHLENIEIKTRFREEFYKNLELIKTKKMSSDEAMALFAKYSIDINSAKADEYNDESESKNKEDLKEDQKSQQPQRNLNNLAKNNENNKKLTKEEENKAIENFLKVPELKAEFLKLQNEANESKEEFEKFLNSYQKLYDANKILNITSAALAGISWALVATYTTLAFWTFGATAPFAAAVALQSSIMTFFVYESFKAQKAMSKDLERIEEFKNSSEYQRIQKFSGMTFDEFKQQLKEEIKVIKPNFTFFYKTINVATTTSAIRMSIRYEIEKVMEKMVSKLFGRKIANESIRETITKLLFKKSYFSAYKVIEKLGISAGVKRGILFTTAFANPLGTAINVIDTLVTDISIVTDIILTNQLKNK
ncbi:hypothetical protein [Mesomycoplasma flocculare]|uniref:hypothetical protein n=1 Tax=Mesomycoplasma flocculare TaxID=2128 RepID=UPI00215D8EE6|nr:hypothetical protein [Mesomycoplasma flocculare]